MNKIHVVLNTALGATLMLLSACAQISPGFYTESLLSETPRSTISVDTSPVARGELVPEKVAVLAFMISGKVEDTLVEVGDEVHRGDILVRLDATTLNTDIARAENVLKAAQTQLELQMEKPNNIEAQTIAAANVAVAEADLSRAKYMLTQSALTAPFDGTIVSIQIEPGEIVTSGREIVTLADFRSMQVETLDLNEMDISQIYIGQAVEVYVNALDLKINGRVSAIAPQTIQMGQNNTCKVTVDLDSEIQGLLWGMNVDARFIIEE